MKKTFVNIKKVYGAHALDVNRLQGKEMSQMPEINNAFISVQNGQISQIGSMSDYTPNQNYHIEDLTDYSLFPSYVDSHTHIIFAEPREGEFEMKIKGASYEEIAADGGGILNSAKKLRETSEDNLFQSALNRAHQMIRMGTGAIEIKSGYGLSIDSELKMLRVANRIKSALDIPVKITFLGAHAFPAEYTSNPERYLSEVLFPAMNEIKKEKLADYVDIFVEKNYFTLEQSHKILDYSDKCGLIPKLHVNQLSNMGGVQLGVDRNALSVDHLEEVSINEIKYLNGKDTIATLLPSCSFFIKIPYAPARKMIDEGLGIALATDYNPVVHLPGI